MTELTDFTGLDSLADQPTSFAIVHMNDDERRDRIREEATRIHESATYSSEMQFEYAKRWHSLDRWVGTLAVGLAAIAGVGGPVRGYFCRAASTTAILTA